MGSLVAGVKDAFKPKTKTVQNPYGDESIETGTTDTSRTDTSTNTTSSQANLQELQNLVSRGTSGGLADTSLLDPLKAALSGYNVGQGAEDAALLNDAIASRVNAQTPAGYESQYRQAAEDYSNLTREIGHRGAALGRGGNARERALGIADRALADSLTRGYDTSRRENENALTNLINQRSQLRDSGLRTYSDLVSKSPFARAKTEDRDVSRTQEEAKQQDSLNELVSLINQNINASTKRKGFTSQTATGPSLFSQLVGAGAAIAKAGSGS